MATIIAGGFDVYSRTQAAIGRLRAAGVEEENLCEFRVNPPGEHDRLAIGGDHHESEGMHTTAGGASKGMAVGAVGGAIAGAGAIPLMGPAGILAGAAAGAYAGSLVGGMKRAEHEPQPDHVDVHPAEALIAVNIDAGTVTEEEVIRILEECGAHQVERAEGRWVDGAWADFDAVSPPRIIGGSDARA